MDRLDIYLPYGNRLVLLFERGTFFFRLLRHVKGKSVYATRKLPIRHDELRELIVTTSYCRVDLGEMVITSDAGVWGVAFEQIRTSAGKAVVYGAVRRFVEQHVPEG